MASKRKMSASFHTSSRKLHIFKEQSPILRPSEMFAFKSKDNTVRNISTLIRNLRNMEENTMDRMSAAARDLRNLNMVESINEEETGNGIPLFDAICFAKFFLLQFLIEISSDFSVY